MTGDFIQALQAIAKERDISADALLETVETALVSAYKKNFAHLGDIRIKVNTSNASFRIYAPRTVIDDDRVPDTFEINLMIARKTVPAAKIGDEIEVDVTPHNMGRIDAQTAKQILVQRIREQERDKVHDEYVDRVGEILTGTVQRKEFKNVYINLGKIEALLPPAEQVDNEPYRFNDRIKLYLLEVRKTPKGPQVLVSRTHPSIIRRLFELEVPEIADGIVTIKSVAREPGGRSKIAVFSRDEKVDPVGACVGHRGSRVQAVVNELYDEKVDIVRWSSDIAQFVSEALSPAKAMKVSIDESSKSAFVIVPDTQLSLAIGKAGQNVRLAARLTGWRIDIRSESQVAKAAQAANATPGDVQQNDAALFAASGVANQGFTPEPHEVEILDEADDSLPMIELGDFDPSKFKD